jgi:hypothetical protein
MRTPEITVTGADSVGATTAQRLAEGYPGDVGSLHGSAAVVRSRTTPQPADPDRP